MVHVPLRQIRLTPASTHLAGQHGEDARELTQHARAPRVGVHDVRAAVGRVHGPDDEHVAAHEPIRDAQVDDEEGRDATPVRLETPQHDERVAAEGAQPEDPDRDLTCFEVEESHNVMKTIFHKNAFCVKLTVRYCLGELNGSFRQRWQRNTAGPLVPETLLIPFGNSPQNTDVNSQAKDNAYRIRSVAGV